VKNRFKDKVFNTAIRENIALAEAPGSRLDIFQYNRNSNGARDYYSLSNELVHKFQNVG
jgi:chromosome partitioning protein